MSRIEQIKAEQKKLADELEGEMLKERANVLAKMKEDIKLFVLRLATLRVCLLHVKSVALEQRLRKQ